MSQRSGVEEHSWSEALANLLKRRLETMDGVAERDVEVQIWADCAGMGSETFAMKKLFPD